MVQITWQLLYFTKIEGRNKESMEALKGKLSKAQILNSQVKHDTNL